MKKLKVDENFKMALRIQPDRQVKKKSKLEKPKSFDIIGNFLYNYGMTGQNLAHDIFPTWILRQFKTAIWSVNPGVIF